CRTTRRMRGSTRTQCSIRTRLSMRRRARWRTAKRIRSRSRAWPSESFDGLQHSVEFGYCLFQLDKIGLDGCEISAEVLQLLRTEQTFVDGPELRPTEDGTQCDDG